MMGKPAPTPETGAEIDVDGHVDAKGIRYIGKAVKMPSGVWLCLADVGGALCRVEVRITATKTPEVTSLASGV
jgi:hypothetical protein